MSATYYLKKRIMNCDTSIDMFENYPKELPPVDLDCVPFKKQKMWHYMNLSNDGNDLVNTDEEEEFEEEEEFVEEEEEEEFEEQEEEEFEEEYKEEFEEEEEEEEFEEQEEEEIEEEFKENN